VLCAALCISGTVYANTDPAESSLPASKVLIIGDSISAAYGMSLAEGWVALLQARLTSAAPGSQVVNASISGETSAGAAARLPGLLQKHQPDILLIELGGNDGLRGYPLKRLRQNLQNMVEMGQASKAAVLLLGMEIPPNYGERYTREFREGYQRVAEATGCQLLPFMLAGIATEPELMQADGIHPRVTAQAMLLENVWPALQAIIIGLAP